MDKPESKAVVAFPCGCLPKQRASSTPAQSDAQTARTKSPLQSAPGAKQPCQDSRCTHSNAKANDQQATWQGSGTIRPQAWGLGRVQGVKGSNPKTQGSSLVALAYPNVHLIIRVGSPEPPDTAGRAWTPDP